MDCCQPRPCRLTVRIHALTRISLSGGLGDVELLFLQGGRIGAETYSWGQKACGTLQRLSLYA